MTNNWSEVKWIFESDGALRDLYVKDTSLQEWMVVIDYLNEHHVIKYRPTGDKSADKIDKDYLIRLWNDETEELELRTASIIIGDIIINTHFFSVDEIEFDIKPSEIHSEKDLDKILSFMNDISRILNKPIILTGENQIDFPLITIDFSRGILNVLTKK